MTIIRCPQTPFDLDQDANRSGANLFHPIRGLSMNIQIKGNWQVVLLCLTLMFLLGACSKSSPKPPESDAELIARAGAPLFDGMGNHHHPITTDSIGAQKYFDQGLVIDFAFNHAESIRSFRAAQKLDANCAMCYWGEALALGPNINVTSNGRVVMSDPDRLAAHTAITKALALKDRVSQAEKDYIEALARRYNGDLSSPRGPLDTAYSDAMRELHKKYPDDNDAASLFAESLMNTMPWDYWLDPDHPKPQTSEVIAALEGVLARAPDHPLALHLYIHAIEASAKPARAEQAADILIDLVPGAGHLVHMPAHIYWRVGRYNDASEANMRAAAVDEAYIAQCNAQGFYPALYYPHNIHFLWAASSMEGRSKIAIEAARRVAANVRLEMIEQFPGVEFFHTIPMLALTQFGRWDEILSEPQPADNLAYSNAIWRYARATALARTNKPAAAEYEYEQFLALAASSKVSFLETVDYPARHLLMIAGELILGEIATAKGDQSGAISHFENAVASQDKLPYTEPPFWYYPTRQSLGAALLAAGQYVAAEAVYRRDLKDYPRNGWSMFGLIESLKQQAKNDEADLIQEKFKLAWALADVTLTSSRM
jgi:tetratricopeptide (TPR) repeat protein